MTSAKRLRAILSGDDLIAHVKEECRMQNAETRLFEPGEQPFLPSSFAVNIKNARVTTADVEQTTVAAFRPWRGS